LDFFLFDGELGSEAKQENIRINVFFIIFKKYLFSSFILLNNYNIINLINDKILFNKNFFIFCKNVFNIIKVGIFVFFIISRGKRIFKNVLNGASSPNIKNFIFYNIYIIKRFYINIISETCFRI
jgi:hypothetical protein